jgi:hypothetical protein
MIYGEAIELHEKGQLALEKIKIRWTLSVSLIGA